jgi:glycosyltransferase involved in cell wall biosynthesis
MKHMKIGINASFLRKPDTGIGQVTRGFVNELLKSESQKDEYFLYLEEDIDQKMPKNFQKRVFLPKMWKRDDLIRKIWWERFLLPKYVKGDKCDLFISLYQCPTFLPNSIRHKMLVHDMVPKIFPEYLDNWRKNIYVYLSWQAAKQADQVMTVSEWSKRDVHKFLKISLAKIKVSHISIGDEFFKDSSYEKDNKILEKYDVYGRYIFYIGGFDFRKNIPELLKAYKAMIEKNNIRDVSLVLAGEDRSRFSHLFTDIKKEIADLKLEDRVKPIGFVKQEDLPAFYRNSEFFVLPTLYEGFGLMLLEAMACGAPAAVSKTSSLPEVGGNAAVYFNPYDAEEMARVMNKILRNDRLRSVMSERGRERAKKFSWKIFSEAILE